MNPVVQRLPSLTLVAIVIVLNVTTASAITAELAKKCQTLAYKTHPPVLAGVKSGTAQAQRDYFNTCVANNGDMPADKDQKPPAGTGK